MTASDWTLPLLDGDSVQFSNINSKLVLLEFWFPGCGGCIRAIPDLNEIHKLYYKKGLRLYGLEFKNKSKKHVAAYVEKRKVEFPILYLAREVADNFGVYAGPSLFLIDKNGKIIYSSMGFKKSDLIQAIEKII